MESKGIECHNTMDEVTQNLSPLGPSVHCKTRLGWIGRKGATSRRGIKSKTMYLPCIMNHKENAEPLDSTVLHKLSMGVFSGTILYSQGSLLEFLLPFTISGQGMGANLMHCSSFGSTRQ